MSKYIINGGQPLSGKVKVAGAKNSSGKLILASILTSEPVFFDNMPNSGEVGIALDIAKEIGAKFKHDAHSVEIETKAVNRSDISHLSGRNRHPVLAIGPLLYRTGQAYVPSLGGDKIGKRPIDFHLNALKKLGAEVKELPSGIQVKASQLTGTRIDLPYPSVGATETLLLTTTWAKGESVINNVAIEPEVIQLIEFLSDMGAKIEIRGRQLLIRGVKNFRGAKATIIPDRLEVASYACLALASRGKILVENARAEHLKPFLDFVERTRGNYQINQQGIEFSAPAKLEATTIQTSPYPGFSTDWQQPSAVVLCTATGESTVHETVYSDRLGYTKDLVKMGAQIVVTTKCQPEICRYQGLGYDHVAKIYGPTKLKGSDSIIPDIRAGMAQVIAALIAEGKSELSGVDHLKRGYDGLVPKLLSLGADIKEV